VLVVNEKVAISMLAHGTAMADGANTALLD
jgi:hypothetical protein